MPRSEILPYICNSNMLGCENGVSSGSIPPRTMWKPQLGVREASATRERLVPFLDQRNPSIRLQLQQIGTKSVVPRLNSTAHDVEIPKSGFAR